MTAGDGLSTVGGSFTLDAPLGRNVWIVAHCADEADLDTIEVVSPSGRIFDLPLVSDGMLHIRIPQTNEVPFNCRLPQPFDQHFINGMTRFYYYYYYYHYYYYCYSK